MKIRAIIVDDEPLARERICALLRGTSDVEVVAECGDGRKAIAAIEKHRPDLLFLDVQMPEPDGFGVLASLSPEKLPVVVFVTAYDRYALRAFEAQRARLPSQALRPRALRNGHCARADAR